MVPAQIPPKMDDVSAMKTRFNEEMYKLKLAKGKNTQLYTLNEYCSLLNKVRIAKEKIANKTPEDYQRLSRYDIIMIGTVQRLIVPMRNQTDPIQYYCFLEETFDIIHLTHISISHGGRNKMMKELKQRYKNITKEFVSLYLSLCEECKKKSNAHSSNNERFSGPSLNNIKLSASTKEAEVKPSQIVELKSRCEVNLIDMQSQPDDEFKFIMVHQDHLTKFVILRPLKFKQAKEVAYHLLDIFTIFGPPCILHSDEGEEYANKVIEELNQVWNEVKIVYDPNSQSQGSVERVNIKEIVHTWMATHKTAEWSEGLKFVQLMKNRAYQFGINCSPYEAMFNCKTQVGINSVLPPFNRLPETASDEDMETLEESASSEKAN